MKLSALVNILQDIAHSGFGDSDVDFILGDETGKSLGEPHILASSDSESGSVRLEFACPEESK